MRIHRQFWHDDFPEERRPQWKSIRVCMRRAA